MQADKESSCVNTGGACVKLIQVAHQYKCLEHVYVQIHAPIFAIVAPRIQVYAENLADSAGIIAAVLTLRSLCRPSWFACCLVQELQQECHDKKALQDASLLFPCRDTAVVELDCVSRSKGRVVNSSRWCVTLGELVHASLVLIDLLPDSFEHIPAILQAHRQSQGHCS